MEHLDPKAVSVFAQCIAYGFTVTRALDASRLDLDEIEARHLASHPDIQAKVKEVIERQVYDTEIEQIKVAHQLEQDREFAIELGQPSAAIQATVARAKVLGVFVERTSTENFVAVSNPEKLSQEEWMAKFAGKEANG